jgi:hypothetical protein
LGFLESLLTKLGLQLVDWLWAKIEAKLEIYFETKSQIKKISNEAGELQEELRNATSDAERIQILRKINSFSDRLGQ